MKKYSLRISIVYGIPMNSIEGMKFSKWLNNEGIAMNTIKEEDRKRIASGWLKTYRTHNNLKIPFMTKLIFKNEKLQSLLRITEESKIFITTNEKDANQNSSDEDGYYETTIPTLWLVKDDGIYLKSAAKLEEIPVDGSHVCYAEGFEPTVPDWWEKCTAAVGGDDFVESFEFNLGLRNGIKQGADMLIEIDEESFVVKLVLS